MGLSSVLSHVSLLSLYTPPAVVTGRPSSYGSAGRVSPVLAAT